MTIPEGTVQILNVGEGDTKLSFDSSNPAEVERAKIVVQDMLKRGYSLLIQVGEKDNEPIYQRARGFDPETCEYIIASTVEETVNIGVILPTKEVVKKKSKRTVKKRIPAKKARAVSVGRTAGG